MFDLISSRYGWDDDYILSLPYSRIMQIRRVLCRAHGEEVQDAWRRSAFVGWQNYCLTELKPGAKHKGFREWCVNFGFWPQQMEKKADTSADRQAALTNAEAFRLRAEVGLRSG